jgi:two-component system copper resistance phosphate regulon response regulator CusR
MTRVLIVEDNPDLAYGLRTGLEIEGYEVAIAGNGETGLDRAKTWHPDLVMLDLMLPGMDGYRVLKQLRESGSDVPVLILTARGEEADKVLGFRLGADDYVTKPFAFEELLARVEALSRRPKALAPHKLVVGDLELDQSTREVRRAGELIELTPKEYTVLEYLMRHSGRVMSRTLITEYAWGYHFDPGTNIVDVVINHLRKKIDARHPHKMITTVRGVGYMIKD